MSRKNANNNNKAMSQLEVPGGTRFTQYSTLLREENLNETNKILINQVSSPQVCHVDQSGAHFPVPRVSFPRIKSKKPFSSTIRYYPELSDLEVAQQLFCDGPTVSPIFLNPVQTNNRFSLRFASNIRLMIDAFTEGRNVYEIDLPSLCELSLRTSAYARLTSMQRITLVGRMVLHLLKIGNNGMDVIHYLNVIEDIFTGRRFPRTKPGHIVVAPPGTGKSSLERTFSLGFLDTDLLNKEILKVQPQIVDSLVDAGFSICTNMWEWRSWRSLKFCVMPVDLRQALEHKNIYPSTMYNMRREALKKFKSNRLIRKYAIQYNQEEWISAYKDIEETIPTYVGDMVEGLIHHYTNLINTFP